MVLRPCERMPLLRVVENRRAVALFAVCFAAFFIPESYSVGVLIYRLWQVLLFSVSSAAFVAFLLWGRINIRWLLLCAFFAFFYVGSSLLSESNGSLALAAFLALKGIGFASLCELGLQRNRRACLAGFLVAGLFFCAIHFASYLIYRDIEGGMKGGQITPRGLPVDQHWFFFTFDNASVFYYLPVLSILWYYTWRYNDRLTCVSVASTVLTIIMYIDLWSAAALVVMVLFGLLVTLLLFRRRLARRRAVRARRCFPSALLVVLSGCVLSLAVALFASSDLMQLIIAQLGKTGAISARVTIWSNSLFWFSDRPLSGVGLLESDVVVSQLTYDHAHNFLLQALYQGGIISAVLVILWMATCAKQCKRSGGSPEVAVIVGSIFLYLLASAVDWYGTMSASFLLFMMLPYMGQSEGSLCKGDGDALLCNEIAEEVVR